MSNFGSLIRGEQWDELVAYLKTDGGREESINAHKDGYKPLHAILEVDRDAPLSVIEAVLSVFPKEPLQYNGEGLTALQYAITLLPHRQDEGGTLMLTIMSILKYCPEAAKMNCPYYGGPTIHLAAGRDSSTNGEVLKSLLETDPDLARMKSNVKSHEGSFPLGVACMKGNEGAIRVLLDAYPEAASFRCSDTGYPLHEVCTGSTYGINPELLQRLISLYPAALTTPGYKDRLPLHIACLNRKNDAIPVLIEADSIAASKADADGNLPLHLALLEPPGFYLFNWYPIPEQPVVRYVLDAYPKGLFHFNGRRQLALHLLLKRTSRIEFSILSEGEDDQDIGVSLRLLWSYLLKEAYHQLTVNILTHEHCKEEESNNHHDTQMEPPSMWHVIAFLSSLFTEIQFNQLLRNLSELRVVGFEGEKTRTMNVDKYNNTLLHLFFLSFTKEFISFIKDANTADESDIAQMFKKDHSKSANRRNTSRLPFGSESDSESESESDAGDILDYRPHLERILQYVQESSIIEMSKQRNCKGELPLHVLLRQICKQEIFYIPQNDVRTLIFKPCVKYDNMCRLIKYHPSSVSERVSHCNKLMPFMIAAAYYTEGSSDEECTQCFSCISDLIRTAGVDSCCLEKSKQRRTCDQKPSASEQNIAKKVRAA